MNSLLSYCSSSDDETESDNESNQSVFRDCDLTAKTHAITTKTGMFLPAPKNVNSIENSATLDKSDNSNILLTLPQPSAHIVIDHTLKEEDDEFLKKKAVAAEMPPTKISQRVKIRIPSLASFKDDDYKKTKDSNKNIGATHEGLLALLPKPKSESIFTASKFRKDESHKSNSFIPYSVANRNKEPTNIQAKETNINPIINNYPDSDDSENEDSKVETKDFFSLNKEDNLPEVSMNEIHAMVAKKAAKIASTASKFSSVTEKDSNMHPAIETLQQHNENSYPVASFSHTLEDDALKQLIGNKVKRKKTEEINIVELSHEEVMPNRNDWMRNALATSTQFVPRGKLSDDELIPGSKRKHQITYLAHQAKTNEAELQAMWAANRQSRRQTQSKYGF